ncbi:Protein of unknown function [Rhodoblastus acidophilus]|uniref:Lipopolysaccharide assembly protein A domain-containing protein n=1 Tax=Rhodoblastus acidophilus TaxID=1074 RepID=A0A212RLV7_RHOAC|nr:lipopolysaccharide assembly protein LapA domain-containing protein [Rhodoblastus acidophilus]MCW2315823.1 putative integral membrane protein [Rhodoblastus acidophilus]PPQ39094.1 DUF1049 domain-containing protein [Rhodoblastus acidophilus]RAI24243.1 DUF1049 domain-containing protein [Rhodoblastus acidophilus]SNB73313.1 Protein of unknown function [Rhodoblastus acidophilus]
MRAVLRFLILAPFAVLLLGFSLANRSPVPVSTDPFNLPDLPLPTFAVPLYLLVVGAMMVGVVLGGSSTWVRQGRHRKAAREASRKWAALRAENEALRNQMTPAAPGTPALPVSRPKN